MTTLKVQRCKEKEEPGFKTRGWRFAVWEGNDLLACFMQEQDVKIFVKIKEAAKEPEGGDG